MKILEHNVQTGEAIERDATSEEVEQMQADAAEKALADQAESEKADAKAALFERLGITADEAALLLS